MKTRLFLFGVLCSVFCLSAPAFANVRYTAQIYDLEGSKDLLFNYKSEGEMKGEINEVTSTFTAPDGNVAVLEKVHFNKEGRAVYYEIEQRQLGTRGRVEIENGKANFYFTKKGGGEKTATENAGTDFIVTTGIPGDLEANWATIMKGDKLKRRLAVVDRMESVGFEFSKEKETESNGEKIVVVKMKPSSFIIAAIVKPLHFYFTADGKILREIQGRTAAKRERNGSFKDLDARSVYTQGDGK